MNRHAFTTKKIIIISCFLLLGLLIGSVYDYQISCALFNEESFFGKIFASYGQLPVTLGSAVIEFILIYASERKLKLKNDFSLCCSYFTLCTSFNDGCNGAKDVLTFINSGSSDYGNCRNRANDLHHLSLGKRCRQESFESFCGFLSFCNL